MMEPGQPSRAETNESSGKKKDVRYMNIVAAKGLADVIRTSLGPKGMDKMITASDGEVTITNDGATILNTMEVVHPAAKILVELSKAQDVEAGDGTTSVVVLAGAMLEKCQELMDMGVHPTAISEAWKQAEQAAIDILKDIAIPITLTHRESLIQSATTSLNSKSVSQHSPLLAPIAADAVLHIVDHDHPENVDLNDIKVVERVGGTVADTELVQGLVFPQNASHAAGGPTSVRDAKIALIQFQLSPPKSDMENSVVVSDYQQMDRILKEEKRYILNMVKAISKAGCNVLLIQKSILRDAVNDIALHFLAKKKIMVVTDIERTDVEFVCKSLGCKPIASVDSFSADKLGFAKHVDELSSGEGKYIRITGARNPGLTCSILVRGSNRLVVREAERSVHDALCVIRCLVKEKNLVVGGGAPEVEMCMRLKEIASKLTGIEAVCFRAYAEAFEVIPYTLAENAGLHPITMVTELRKQHAAGVRYAGINVRKGTISDLRSENVVQPLLVSLSALKLATESVRMLLKIDDIVSVR